MNYNSVNEIFSANISNMTILRNNSVLDSGADTVQGVDWFVFEGSAANNIYAAGDSYIGFGANLTQLKVGYDSGFRLKSLYREEGTLYNYYKFLKIRWDGNIYNRRAGIYYQKTYDVVLWDTGDISLHMVTIPSSNNSGPYELSEATTTYPYTVSTESPDVTFLRTNNGFTVTNSMIVFGPREYRYLVRSDASYYTVVDNALSEIDVSELSSNIFNTFGTEYIPSANLMLGLPNPELLCWSEHEEDRLKTGLVVNTIPPLPQIVYGETQTITDGSIIDKSEVYNAKDVFVSISFDNGQTWKYFNDETWVYAISESEGMTAETLQNITPEQWATIAPYTSVQFRCALMSKESQMGKIYFNLAQTNTEA